MLVRPEGFEPPTLLIRSQMLYPLSYQALVVADGVEDYSASTQGTNPFPVRMGTGPEYPSTTGLRPCKRCCGSGAHTVERAVHPALEEFTTASSVAPSTT